MRKTKLGISVGLLGAAIYFVGLFSGYFVMVLLAGYVLLVEDNEWLRRASVKALVLSVAFSLASLIIGFIPDAIEIIRGFLGIFKISFTTYLLNQVISIVQNVIRFCNNLLFIILGFKSLRQGTVIIPAIDRMISKYM